MQLKKKEKVIREGDTLRKIEEAVTMYGTRWTVRHVGRLVGTQDDPQKVLWAVYINGTQDFIFAPSFPAQDLEYNAGGLSKDLNEGAKLLDAELQKDPWTFEVRKEQRKSKNGRAYTAWIFDDSAPVEDRMSSPFDSQQSGDTPS